MPSSRASVYSLLAPLASASCTNREAFQEDAGRIAIAAASSTLSRQTSPPPTNSLGGESPGIGRHPLQLTSICRQCASQNACRFVSICLAGFTYFRRYLGAQRRHERSVLASIKTAKIENLSGLGFLYRTGRTSNFGWGKTALFDRDRPHSGKTHFL